MPIHMGILCEKCHTVHFIRRSAGIKPMPTPRTASPNETVMFMVCSQSPEVAMFHRCKIRPCFPQILPQSAIAKLHTLWDTARHPSFQPCREKTSVLKGSLAVPLPAPSKSHGLVRVSIPRIEDKKIQRLLALLAKKMGQTSQSETQSKKIA